MLCRPKTDLRPPRRGFSGEDLREKMKQLGDGGSRSICEKARQVLASKRGKLREETHEKD